MHGVKAALAPTLKAKSSIAPLAWSVPLADWSAITSLYDEQITSKLVHDLKLRLEQPPDDDTLMPFIASTPSAVSWLAWEAFTPQMCTVKAWRPVNYSLTANNNTVAMYMIMFGIITA
ncbi:unnamed protein product [Sphagnum balticum]